MSGTRRILVVEDDEVIRRLMRAALIRAGFEVTEIDDSERAIETLREEAFDGILLDLMILPHGGSSVLQWLESERQDLLTRTIVVSAATPQELENAISGRPCSAIAKPFDIDELVAAVLRCAAGGDSGAHSAPDCPA